MTSILGSLSFAKLVIMSWSSPQNLQGVPEIHVPRSFHSWQWTPVVPYNLDSNLYKEYILSMLNAINAIILIIQKKKKKKKKKRYFYSP